MCHGDLLVLLGVLHQELRHQSHENPVTLKYSFRGRFYRFSCVTGIGELADAASDLRARRGHAVASETISTENTSVRVSSTCRK